MSVLDCVGEKPAYYEIRLMLAHMIFNFDLCLPGYWAGGLPLFGSESLSLFD